MMWHDMCGPGGWGPGGSGMLLHGGFMLPFLAILGVGLCLLIRFAVRSGSSSQGLRPTGLAALDERYARGEIEREEYLQKRQDISQ